MTSKASSGARRPDARSTHCVMPGGPCPCGRGETYGDCCGLFHVGDANAPTAERLMRSRYSAFVVHDVDYLVATWHPSTRPSGLALETDRRWLGLEIVALSHGGLLDPTGEVEFVARSVVDGRREAQSERSRFVRHGGRWTYLDGVVEG